MLDNKDAKGGAQDVLRSVVKEERSCQASLKEK